MSKIHRFSVGLVTVLALFALFGGPVPASAGDDADDEVTWVRDRLEILNVVQSFSHFLDARRFEDWQALFTDDVFFEAFPGDGTRLEIRGKPALVAFFEHRYNRGGLASGQRRHALSTIRVAEQTATTARVNLYVMISMAVEGRDLVFVTTGTYDISLLKTADGWKANGWQIRSDVEAGPAIEVPEAARDHMNVSPAGDRTGAP